MDWHLFRLLWVVALMTVGCSSNKVIPDETEMVKKVEFFLTESFEQTGKTVCIVPINTEDVVSSMPRVGDVFSGDATIRLDVAEVTDPYVVVKPVWLVPCQRIKETSYHQVIKSSPVRLGTVVGEVIPSNNKNIVGFGLSLFDENDIWEKTEIAVGSDKFGGFKLSRVNIRSSYPATSGIIDVSQPKGASVTILNSVDGGLPSGWSY